MLFNSWVFVVFFAAVLAVHYALRKANLRNAWVLAASYFFYGWLNPLYPLLLVYATLASYAVARAIAVSPRKKRWLALGVTNGLAMLSVFKYGAFLTDNLNCPARAPGHRGRHRAARQAPAGRHLFLHPAHHRLPGGCLPRQGARRKEHRPLRDLHRLLPLPPGRSDRAGRGDAPPARPGRPGSRPSTSARGCRCSWWASSRRSPWRTSWPSMSTRFTAGPPRPPG